MFNIIILTLAYILGYHHDVLLPHYVEVFQYLGDLIVNLFPEETPLKPVLESM